MNQHRVLCRVVSFPWSSKFGSFGKRAEPLGLEQRRHVVVELPGFQQELSLVIDNLPDHLKVNLEVGLRFHATAHIREDGENVEKITDFEYDGKTLSEQKKRIADLQERMEQQRTSPDRQMLRVHFSADFEINNLPFITAERLERFLNHHAHNWRDGRYPLDVEVFRERLFQMVRNAALDCIQDHTHTMFPGEIIEGETGSTSRWVMEAEPIEKELFIWAQDGEQDKIEVTMASTKSGNFPKPISELDECPFCGTRWKGEDIFDYFMQLKEDGDPYYGPKTVEQIKETAGHYGWTEENPQHFSHLIGIEVQTKYDGVSYWRCPNDECRCTWDRFTNLQVEPYVFRKGDNQHSGD